jgi:hypothetical protein
MVKGILKTIEGNVLNPQLTHENEIVVIPHVCNAQGKMGAGVALGIRKKWPVAFTTYSEVIDRYKFHYTPSREVEKNQALLGKNDIAPVEENIIIVNMIAQDGFISPSNPKPIKYMALIECMQEIANCILNSDKNKTHKYVIHAPKFGSLRSGGNFDFVLDLIKEIWLDNGIDVVIYEYKE